MFRVQDEEKAGSKLCTDNRYITFVRSASFWLWGSSSAAVDRSRERRRTWSSSLASTMITHVKLVNLPVRDQDRALDFYTEKLGFSILTDQPFDSKQRWIELRPPKAETRVVLFTPDGQEDRIGTFSNVVFNADDIDKTYAELKARGVEFLGEPQKQPWGSFVLFKDPDGNIFCLSSS